MRSPSLVVLTLALAALTAACGTSADEAAGASTSAGAGPEVRAFQALCTVAADVAAGDATGAEATFQDEVHETLHELADRLETSDREASAALLEAKSKVEADFLEPMPDTARLGADVDGLVAAMADAMAAAGLQPPGCPEPAS